MSSSFFPIWVMYSAMEREGRRIKTQEYENISHGLRVLKWEVGKSKRIFYELQDSWEKEVQHQENQRLRKNYYMQPMRSCFPIALVSLENTIRSWRESCGNTSKRRCTIIWGSSQIVWRVRRNIALGKSYHHHLLPH